MPALSYKKQVARYVEDGTKPHTVRMERKRPIKAGDTLYHYEAMRTVHCRFLGASICTAVKKIEIKLKEGILNISIDDEKLNYYQMCSFIYNDGFIEERGFGDWTAFIDFFFPARKHNHMLTASFTGVVIYFEPVKPNHESDK